MKTTAGGWKPAWKRGVLVGALALAAAGAVALSPVLALAGPPGHGGRHGGGHHRGGHVSVVVGPAWWGPYWGYPGPWGYYGPWYYDYPRVVVEEPRVYVEAPQVPPPPTEGYWYYCPSSRAYYPTVQTCPEPWVKVPPRPE